MKLQTDPKVIAALAAEKADENWKFRAFLKALDVEDTRLDALVHTLYRDIAAQIDCSACANCCKVLLPALDDDEVKRLADKLDMAVDQLIERLLTPSETPDRMTFKTTPCPLLEDNRCTAGAAKPEGCRSFPNLHKHGFTTRLIQVVHNCTTCPIVYNVYERLKEELGFDYYDDEPASEDPWDEGLPWFDFAEKDDPYIPD